MAPPLITHLPKSFLLSYTFFFKLACSLQALKAAEAEAEAIRRNGEAQAAVVRAKGLAEAERMTKKAEAWKNYSEAAYLEMLINRLPEVRRLFCESCAVLTRCRVGCTDAHARSCVHVRVRASCRSPPRSRAPSATPTRLSSLATRAPPPRPRARTASPRT